MRLLNSLSKTGYWILIIIPVLYLVVATYSYFSVLHTFGEVPEVHNMLEELAETKKLPINIFPVEYGAPLMAALAVCYLTFPFFLLINYFVHKKSNINFHKRYTIAIVVLYVALFLLLRLEPFGWYMLYILD
jgi:hypothetical protein